MKIHLLPAGADQLAQIALRGNWWGLAGERLSTVFGDAEEQAHDVLLQDRPEQYFLYLARR